MRLDFEVMEDTPLLPNLRRGDRFALSFEPIGRPAFCVPVTHAIMLAFTEALRAGAVVQTGATPALLDELGTVMTARLDALPPLLRLVG